MSEKNWGGKTMSATYCGTADDCYFEMAGGRMVCIHCGRPMPENKKEEESLEPTDDRAEKQVACS